MPHEVLLPGLQKGCPRRDARAAPAHDSCLQGKIFGNHPLNLPGLCHSICPVLWEQRAGFCSPGHPREPARDTWPEGNHQHRVKHGLPQSKGLSDEPQHQTQQVPQGRPETIQYFISKSHSILFTSQSHLQVIHGTANKSADKRWVHLWS